MAARTRTPSQRSRDMLRTAQLYRNGKTQAAIAKEIGVSRSQITKDLREIRRWWIEETVYDIDLMKTKELARIDELEDMFIAAWEASTKPSTVKTASVTTAGAKPGKTSSVKEISSAGDPRFLEGIQRCIDMRCRILGLNGAVKMNVTLVDTFKDEDMESIAREYLEGKS